VRLAAKAGVTLITAAAIAGCAREMPAPRTVARAVTAAFATAQLPDDPDDCAVWRHPEDPSRSLIIGTVKVAAPGGAIAVFGLDGGIRQLISGVDRPNNVDVEYGLQLGGARVDVAVATERLKRQLRVFRIDAAAGQLVDLGGLPVLEGQAGEAGAPMGIALYRRQRDQAIFAIIAPKTGPQTGYLWQYRLVDRGGRIAAEFVRRFGNFSAATLRSENEIEAVAVDDELGYVYYSDEADGVHKWHADPDHPGAGNELAHFARAGFQGDREGIAIYARADGTGYIVVTDQLESDSEYHVYAREGAAGNPHDHSRDIAVLRGGADSTDGLEIFSGPLGPRLPHGAMIAMNSTARNFLVFRWEDVASAVGR
jgi:3-phytase